MMRQDALQKCSFYFKKSLLNHKPKHLSFVSYTYVSSREENKKINKCVFNILKYFTYY
jgi:hypothetical protein